MRWQIKEHRSNLVIWGLFWRHIRAFFLSKNTERRHRFMMLRLYNLMRWRNQRTPVKSGDQRVLLETHWGLPSVKEHREETLIYDAEVAKSNAFTKSKNTDQIWWWEGSFWDLLVPSWRSLGALLGHRRCLPVWHVQKAPKQRHCRKKRVRL